MLNGRYFVKTLERVRFETKQKIHIALRTDANAATSDPILMKLTTEDFTPNQTTGKESFRKAPRQSCSANACSLMVV